MKNIFYIFCLLAVLATANAKSWSDLTTLFPGQPGQPFEYLGTGTFRLADYAIASSADGSDPRVTYDENFVLVFESDGSHRLEFLVNYVDETELGSIMYPSQLFAPYLEASVVLDDKNMIDTSVPCKFNPNSLPDIFVPDFWNAVTAAGTLMHFVDVRDYRGVRCDYFEGVIPGDGNQVPDTVIGWYNRWTGSNVDKYGPMMYFLGPAQFEQTLGYPSPTLLKSEDHLTRRLVFPATWFCKDITDAFLEHGTIPNKRDNNDPVQQVRDYLSHL